MRLYQTYVVSWVYGQVCLHITLVCAPDCSSHAGPWFPEGKNALNIVSFNLLPRNGIDYSRVNAKEWKRCTARLSGGDTSKRRDDMGTSLSLPISLHSLVIAISRLTGNLR